MQQLLDQLNSRNSNVRDIGMRHARALPPDELLKLVALEHQTISTRRKEANYIFWIVILTLHTCIGFFFRGLHFAGQMLNLLKYGLAITCQQIHRNRYSRARNQLTQLVQEVNDVRFVAPLLRFNVEVYGTEASANLRVALKRLLPQIRADHAPQWSKEDKATLLLPFRNPNNDWELTLACLKALEQVGDASAIPAVRKLADFAARENLQKTWRATQDCLFYLESNTSQFQQVETLLRSSNAAATRPESLLRPAQSAPDTTPAEQLLRPGE